MVSVITVPIISNVELANVPWNFRLHRGVQVFDSHGEGSQRAAVFGAATQGLPDAFHDEAMDLKRKFDQEITETEHQQSMNHKAKSNHQNHEPHQKHESRVQLLLVESSQLLVS